MPEQSSEIVIFKTEDDKVSIDVHFDKETVWLTLDQMAVLFERDKSTISRHIKNVFEECELDRIAVVAIFATTATDNKVYQVDHYNLDGCHGDVKQKIFHDAKSIKFCVPVRTIDNTLND